MLQRLVLSSFDGGGNEDGGDIVTMVHRLCRRRRQSMTDWEERREGGAIIYAYLQRIPLSGSVWWCRDVEEVCSILLCHSSCSIHARARPSIMLLVLLTDAVWLSRKYENGGKKSTAIYRLFDGQAIC